MAIAYLLRVNTRTEIQCSVLPCLCLCQGLFQGLYFGFGYGLGALFGGLAAANYGYQVLFMGAAAAELACLAAGVTARLMLARWQAVSSHPSGSAALAVHNVPAKGSVNLKSKGEYVQLSSSADPSD